MKEVSSDIDDVVNSIKEMEKDLSVVILIYGDFRRSSEDRCHHKGDRGEGPIVRGLRTRERMRRWGLRLPPRPLRG